MNKYVLKMTISLYCFYEIDLEIMVNLCRRKHSQLRVMTIAVTLLFFFSSINYPLNVLYMALKTDLFLDPALIICACYIFFQFTNSKIHIQSC